MTLTARLPRPLTFTPAAVETRPVLPSLAPLGPDLADLQQETDRTLLDALEAVTAAARLVPGIAAIWVGARDGDTPSAALTLALQRA